MDRRWAQAIAEQWMGLAPGSVDVDPHRKSIRQARIVDGLAVLLPQAQEWAVVPSIKVGDPPGGSHWLDHEVLVLVEDGVYRVGGLEPDEEQPETPELPDFALAVRRVDNRDFKGAHVTQHYREDHGATWRLRRWHFLGDRGPALVIDESHLIDSNAKPEAQAKLARALAQRLGWSGL